MADEKKAQMTDDLELMPGVVVTPGYEVPARPENVGGFGDRRIIVHEDGAAVMKDRAKYFTAEVADHPIASTYEAKRGTAAAEADSGAAAREHAKAAGKA